MGTKNIHKYIHMHTYLYIHIYFVYFLQSPTNEKSIYSVYWKKYLYILLLNSTIHSRKKHLLKKYAKKIENK